jgi:hypothetical protein
LVIIGVVVVLSLVVVGVLSGFLGSSSDASLSSNKLLWQSQPVGLSEVGADQVGDTFFVVTNNTGEDITLLGYRANGLEREFTETTPLVPRGGKKVVFIARQEACVTNGSTCSLDGLSFKYRSASGLEKNSSVNDLVIEKQSNVSIAMFDGQPTALVCVNNGDVGQCGNSSDTNSWTAGIINDLNIFQIDLNTAGNLRADGNYLCDANACYKISDLNISSSGGGVFTNPLTTDLNISKANAQVTLINPDTNYYSRLTRTSTNDILSLTTMSTRLGGLGYDLNFNGTKAYATAPNSANLSGDYSVCVWAKLNGTSKYTNYPNVLLGFGRLRETDNGIIYQPNVDRLNIQLNGVSLGWVGGQTTSSWNFFCLTRSGSSFVLYKNNGSSILTATNAAAQTNYAYINMGTNADPTTMFPGSIDEPLVFTRALSVAEIQTLYNSGVGIQANLAQAPWNNGLIWGAHCNEGTGTTVSAFVGSNATLSTSSWATGIVPADNVLSEVNVIRSVDGGTSSELSQIIIGNYSTAFSFGSKNIYEGLNHNWNILGNQKMILDSSGNVGIGTTVPTNRLDVNGDITLGTGSTTKSTLFVNNSNGTAPNTSHLIIQPLSGNNSTQVTVRPLGTGGVPAIAVQDSPTGATGAHNFFIGTGDNSVAANAWNFSSTIIGNANAASWPIGFNVSNVANGRFTAMTINSNGNVGIGTTNPSNMLHVVGASGANAIGRFTRSAETDYSATAYYPTAAPAPTTPSWGVGLMPSTNSFNIWSYNGTTNTQRLTVDSSGNVGIGITSPTTALDVNGALKAQGYKSSDGTAGYTGTCTAGMTITVKDGLITGCA